MTVREALKEGRKLLSEYQPDSPALDVSLILSSLMKITREKLYMIPDKSLDKNISDDFFKALDRRVSGEPVAWITGKKEFYGIDIYVGPGVLCPRPDTEILVEAVINEFSERKNADIKLHDCCCGPGTITAAIYTNFPGWEISASDISGSAEKYFHINNKKTAEGKIKFIKADLLSGIKGMFNIITANPPYLTPEDTENKIKNKGWKEPSLALDGKDSDGLGLIRKLIPQVYRHLYSGGVFFMEADPFQMPIITNMLENNGFTDISVIKDLAGMERVIRAGVL